MTDRSPDVLEAVEKINAKWPGRIMWCYECEPGHWEDRRHQDCPFITNKRILQLAKQIQEQNVQQ